MKDLKWKDMQSSLATVALQGASQRYKGSSGRVGKSIWLSPAAASSESHRGLLPVLLKRHIDFSTRHSRLADSLRPASGPHWLLKLLKQWAAA
ncbi:hypothetical protein SRHO_G00262410 [Serrasalmus rhombeus]